MDLSVQSTRPRSFRAGGGEERQRPVGHVQPAHLPGGVLTHALRTRHLSPSVLLRVPANLAAALAPGGRAGQVASYPRRGRGHFESTRTSQTEGSQGLDRKFTAVVDKSVQEMPNNGDCARIQAPGKKRW